MGVTMVVVVKKVRRVDKVRFQGDAFGNNNDVDFLFGISGAPQNKIFWRIRFMNHSHSHPHPLLHPHPHLHSLTGILKWQTYVSPTEAQY